MPVRAARTEFLPDKAPDKGPESQFCAFLARRWGWDSPALLRSPEIERSACTSKVPASARCPPYSYTYSYTHLSPSSLFCASVPPAQRVVHSLARVLPALRGEHTPPARQDPRVRVCVRVRCLRAPVASRTRTPTRTRISPLLLCASVPPAQRVVQSLVRLFVALCQGLWDGSGRRYVIVAGDSIL